ncbi:MAG: DUF3365 domain-containing protein [Bacteroidia bacterium]
MKNWFLFLMSGALTALFLPACTSPATSEKQQEVADSVYIAQGKTIAGAVFSKLSGELSAAMQSGGVEKAVPYCHLHAYPLTDSLSAVYSAYIRRASHKPRNPQNAADSLEAATIAMYAEKMAGGEKPTPVVVREKEGAVRFLAPILLAAPCLKCHGDIDHDISPEKYALIQNIYPDDKATGFAEGELRGVWSIRFE